MNYIGDDSPPSHPEIGREVKYEFGKELPDVLDQFGLTVLVSTYQAGKIVSVGSSNRQLQLSFHGFDRPMGMAVKPSLGRLAVATKQSIWVAHNELGVARQFSAGSCFMTRTAHLTGDIAAHQIRWIGEELWIVNTRFSCLCTVDAESSFVPRWRPEFIDELANEDRCHLNGLAADNSVPRFVTALSQTNAADGWRPIKNNAGCIIDVQTNAIVVDHLAMPHSPTLHGHKLLFLESGRGTLNCVDTATQHPTQPDVVGRFPGFTRGLVVYGHMAFVGLSRIRETSTFGGLPISEKRQELRCGFAIVDLRKGSLISQFEFKSGVDEIFDLELVAHPGRTLLYGPRAEQDGQEPVWIVSGGH